jgi:hypothetical protein
VSVNEPTVMRSTEVVVRQSPTPVPAIRNEQVVAYDVVRPAPTPADPS